jgi:hypothetical protein
MTLKPVEHPDGDVHKGAVESQTPNEHGHETTQHDNLADQLPHRNTGDWLEGADSDFPEPGSNPEHSGQHK